MAGKKASSQNRSSKGKSTKKSSQSVVKKSDVKKAVKTYKGLSKPMKILVAILAILIIIGSAGAYYYFFVLKKDDEIKGEISIHFLELGNKYTGDCIYIKAGENDILIDGGSRTSSEETIKNYVDNYVSDGILEYAIITHADQDHIASWAGDKSHNSLFDDYEVKTIIDFARSDKTSDVYKNYCEKRDAEVENGAVHYTALECYNNENGAQSVYQLADGITLQILYNYYYENKSSSENNYSVCFMINHGNNHYLFTGDLEKEGEKKLIEYNSLPQVTLFKAGHHGSGTSTTEELLSVIKPTFIAITTVAGSTEYSHNLNNTFPYQETIDRIAK